jgi:hypothetical protein
MSYKYEVGSAVQMMSTELNALANNSGITQNTTTNPAFDNGNAANLFFWGDLELTVTFASAPTANSTVEVYIVPAENGTNYATTTDGASPIVDLNSFIGSFNIPAQTSAIRRNIRGIPLPPCLFKLYAIDKAGVAFPATGSVITLYPYREQ